MDEAWILGDIVLNSAVEAFRFFSTQKSYLTENYDLRIIYGALGQTHNGVPLNILARLLNSFIDAINSNIKLPTIVFIFLDADFEQITGGRDH